MGPARKCLVVVYLYVHVFPRDQIPVRVQSSTVHYTVQQFAGVLIREIHVFGKSLYQLGIYTIVYIHERKKQLVIW
jgi:hypothetical protein